MIEKVTVEDMYKYFTEIDEPMLSTFSGDFWDVYEQFYAYFDRLFCHSYRSFVIFGIKDQVDMHNAASEWSLYVISFLKMNEKRYSELYRLQNVSDVDYSLLEPYNVTESHTVSNTGSVTDNKGAKSRSKQNSTSYGAVNTTDNGSTIHGAKSKSDSEQTAYGQDKITTEEENNIGRQNNEQEHKRSAMNETTYSPKDITSDEFGARQDTAEKVETRATRTDSTTGTHTEASFTDTNSNTHSIGAHSDTESGTIQDAAYTDTRNTTERETKSITKKGNMGIYSLPKLLSEHKELWDAFNFYKMIFDEIAEEFLRIEYI